MTKKYYKNTMQFHPRNHGKNVIGCASFVDPFCYLCFVFGSHTVLFVLVAVWSPDGKGLTTWFSYM